MDKPNINIRAWQPIEKRKKENIPKIKKQPILINDKFEENFNDNLNTEIYYDESFNSSAWNNSQQYDKYYKREDNIEGDFYINKKYSNNKYHKQKKKRKIIPYINTQLIKTIGTGVGAIATGVFLGYLILNFLFGTNEQESLTITPSNDTQIVNYDDTTEVVTGQVIPEQIKYFIQAGVFSNLSGAETIVKQQRDLGRSAIVKQDNSYYVFIGMAGSKDQANLLKEFIASEGADLYTKQYVISERRFNMKDDTFAVFSNFINTGQQLVNILSENSIQTIVNSQYKIDYDEIQDIHQKFLLDIQNLKTSLDKENLVTEKDLVQNMSDQINYAMAAVNAYKKNPNSQYLWNIQELLIKYELYYEGYVKKID